MNNIEYKKFDYVVTRKDKMNRILALISAVGLMSLFAMELSFIHWGTEFMIYFFPTAILWAIINTIGEKRIKKGLPVKVLNLLKTGIATMLVTSAYMFTFNVVLNNNYLNHREQVTITDISYCHRWNRDVTFSNGANDSILCFKKLHVGQKVIIIQHIGFLNIPYITYDFK